MSKNITKMILPYSFKGFLPSAYSTQIRFLTLRAAEENLSPQIHPAFSSIYTSVLTALCDHDLEYLNGVMENRLYERTKQDLEKLKEKKLKLNYVEPNKEGENENSQSEEEKDEDVKLRKIGNKFYATEKGKNKVLHHVPYAFEEKDMKVNLEALGVLGANIDRESNRGKVIPFHGKTRIYYLNLKSPLELIQKQILVMNAYFLTKRKIFVSDEENFVIHGTEEVNKWLAHKWRFETYNNNVDWVPS